MANPRVKTRPSQIENESVPSADAEKQSNAARQPDAARQIGADGYASRDVLTKEPPTDQALFQAAEALGQQLLARGWQVATAESCTGGWIAKCLTDVAGSSAWFDRGFLTYSNAAKQEMLGVNAETLATYGAVSEAVVAEMACGALRHSGAQLAVAVSGVAGPGGGSTDKPVGNVCFGLAHVAGSPTGAEPAQAESGRSSASGCACMTQALVFQGDREAVRRQSVGYALTALSRLLQQNASPQSDP